jgi:hypothetical protein
MHSGMQVVEILLELPAILRPRHTIDPRSCLLLQPAIGPAQSIDRDMVEERSELRLLILLRYFTHTVERTGHVTPTLRSVRVLLARVPLG